MPKVGHKTLEMALWLEIRTGLCLEVAVADFDLRIIGRVLREFAV